MQSTIILQRFFHPAREFTNYKEEHSTDEMQILNEIADVTKKLENVKNKFDYAVESDVIDSLIYQELSLHSRYSYLIKLAKQKGIVCSPCLNIMEFNQKIQTQ